MPSNIDDEHSACVLVLDSRDFDSGGVWNALQAIEDMLYGTTSTDPKIPTASEVLSSIENAGKLLDSNGNSILDFNDNAINSSVYKNV